MVRSGLKWRGALNESSHHMWRPGEDFSQKTHSKKELWGTGRSEWTTGRLEFIKENIKSYSSTAASRDHGRIFWAPKCWTTHSSAGLPEVHIAPVLSQLSSVPTAFFGRNSTILDSPTRCRLHYNLDFTVSFTQ